MMNTCPPRAVLEQLLDVGLETSLRTRVEEHVEDCPACKKVLDAMTCGVPSVLWPIMEARQGPELDAAAAMTGNDSQICMENPALLSEKARTVISGQKARVQGGGETTLPRRVGRFEVTSFLGSGAFGEVYRARDPQLERDVALKLARPEILNSAERIKRFQREARAAADLRHPHIVPIFDAGTEGSRHFIAGAFISGHTLAEELKQQPSDHRRAAEITRQLAEALAYAHGRGIIHRDVKPGNVMIDEAGDSHLMDFGLAARAHDEEKLTQDGQCMGTPAYLAPEQAQGKAGAASDQYSLGCTLYEMLTGQTPFSGTLEAQILYHQHQEPARPRSLNAALPLDLETICLKCLEKDPARRYHDCQALADDLRRWLEGMPIAARRIGVVERTGRWCRRNPAVAGLLAAVMLVTLIGLSAVAHQLDRALSAEEELTKTAGKLRDKAETLSAKTEELQKQIELSEFYLANGKLMLAHADSKVDVDWAYEHLDAVPAGLRKWDWRLLRRQIDDSLFALYGHTNSVTSVAFSPDGSRLATSSGDQTVRLWDGRTGQQMLELKGHAHWIHGVAFSPDGTRLVSSSSGDGSERLWDVRTGQQLIEFKRPGGVFTRSSVAFTADGGGLASFADGVFRLWDVRSGQLLQRRDFNDREDKSLTGPALSPNGALLAAGFTRGDGFLQAGWRLWDVRTGKVLLEEVTEGASVNVIAFSPDSTCLATGGYDGIVELWDVRTGKKLHRFDEGFPRSLFRSNEVLSIAFSPDGARVASGGGLDKTVRLWDVRSGKKLLELRGHSEGITALVFSPDGIRLASASMDQTVKLWDSRTGPQWPLELKVGHPVQHVAFRPDSVRLVTAVDEGRFYPDGRGSRTLIDWDVRTGRRAIEQVWNGETGKLFSKNDGPAFTPDGGRFIRAVEAGTFVFDVRTGQRLFPLGGFAADKTEKRKQLIAFSPDGNHMAMTIVGEKTVRLWCASPEQSLIALEGRTEPTSSLGSVPVFSPDGSRVACGVSENVIRVWDTRSGGKLVDARGHDNAVVRVAFSPDGGHLASLSLGGTIRLWDAQTGKPIRQFKKPTEEYYSSLIFSEDGKHLVALASLDPKGKKTVWDTQTGELVAESPKEMLHGASPYSPNGKIFAHLHFPGNSGIHLIRMELTPEEIQERLFWTRPDPAWHESEARRRAPNQPFAAAFHRERLALLEPWSGERWLWAGEAHLAAGDRQRAAICFAHIWSQAHDPFQMHVPRYINNRY